MNLLVFFSLWFIVSIPAAILLGKFIAAGNGMGTDTASCPEKECDNFLKNQIQGYSSFKDAA